MDLIRKAGWSFRESAFFFFFLLRRRRGVEKTFASHLLFIDGSKCITALKPSSIAQSKIP